MLLEPKKGSVSLLALQWEGIASIHELVIIESPGRTVQMFLSGTAEDSGCNATLPFTGGLPDCESH